jgi:hypothetical protein
VHDGTATTAQCRGDDTPERIHRAEGIVVALAPEHVDVVLDP